MDLIERQLPVPKGRAIEVALPMQANPRLFTYRNREFAFVSFSYEQDLFGGRFMVGRLAKKKEIGVGQLRDQDIVEITTDDWIPVWLAIDISGQYMAVEMNPRFGGLEHVLQVLQHGLTAPIQHAYRHEILISAVTDARAFWDIVHEANRIFRVSLKFVSPNFLNTPRRARELLQSWKEIYNQTEANIDLKNEEGELRVPEDDLTEPVEYISAGEGSWTLEVGTADRPTRQVFTSRDGTETFQVNIPRASRPADELEAAPQKERTLIERLMEVLRRRNAA
jgi:hypothetical protein